MQDSVRMIFLGFSILNLVFALHEAPQSGDGKEDGDDNGHAEERLFQPAARVMGRAHIVAASECAADLRTGLLQKDRADEKHGQDDLCIGKEKLHWGLS